MVYDCFMFFNELELLEVRINELSSVVDKFVLVESTKTHQGNPKPLYYEENKNKFREFTDRIIHVVVEFPPQITGAYERDNYQRQMIMEGLKNCLSSDIIIISDLDEIPSSAKIIEYKDKPGIKLFRQSVFYYYLNCRGFVGGHPYFWFGSVMAPYSLVKDPQSLRDLRGRFGWLAEGNGDFLRRTYHHLGFFAELLFRFRTVRIVAIPNGGWHFSYLGGTERIIQKLEAFAHPEYNKDEYKNALKIEKALNASGEIKDLLGQKDTLGQPYTWKPIPIDESFPSFLRNNLKRYSRLILEVK